MEISHQSVTESIERINAIGMWPTPVAAFLKRPAALDFIEVYLHETGTSVDEAVLLLLAAIRYIDNKAGYAADVPTVLEAPPGAANIDLFLVRHHAELYHLCRSRRIQTNLPQRAFPVLEVLQRRFGNERLALIELGAAFGLIGRVLCSPRLALERFGDYFDPSQQRPAGLAEVALYRGFDLSVPDPGWLLACSPFASDRLRLERFINEMPAGPDFLLSPGLARDFPEYTGVIELEPRFAASHADPLVPVVLTSFLLYQLPEAARRTLVETITAWTAERGGAWVNLDHRVMPDGLLRFGLELDGCLQAIFANDGCLSWTAV